MKSLLAITFFVGLPQASCQPRPGRYQTERRAMPPPPTRLEATKRMADAGALSKFERDEHDGLSPDEKRKMTRHQKRRLGDMNQTYDEDDPESMELEKEREAVSVG